MNHQFLNVDLDIQSRSNFDPLLAALTPQLIILHAESGPRKHFAILEISRIWKNPTPEKTIDALCDAIEKLSKKNRHFWKRAHSKIFDIGIEVYRREKSYRTSIPLSLKLQKRIAALDASIRFTVYNHNDSSPKEKGGSH